MAFHRIEKQPERFFKHFQKPKDQCAKGIVVGCGGSDAYGGIGTGVGEAEITVVRFSAAALECVVYIKFGAVSDIISNAGRIFAEVNRMDSLVNLSRLRHCKSAELGSHRAACGLAAAVRLQ